MQKIWAEFLGTAFLLMVVVGSGIMGDQLAGNAGLALLANSIATGAGLYVLIQCVGPISGAHFNPIVTGLAFWQEKISFRLFSHYIVAQFLGAVSGVLVVHLLFAQPILQISSKVRFGSNLWVSEVVATLGLLATIHLSEKSNSAPSSVALYITAAYWFTSSTSFANPAVTLARSLTNSFCGIAPPGVLPFILAQLVALLLFYLLLRTTKNHRVL